MNMKKTFLILAFVAIVGTVLSSCKSNKPPCPAYSQVEQHNVTNPNV